MKTVTCTIQIVDGRVWASKVRGKPVRDRVITQNLKTISAVLNWATMAGDGQGG